MTTRTTYGSHMPLDTTPHWRWDNPLNLIPALVAAAILIAVIGTLIG